MKSLSHEGRLQILCLLIDAELSVTQLATALQASPVSFIQESQAVEVESLI